MTIGVTEVQGLRLCTAAFVSWNKMQGTRQGFPSAPFARPVTEHLLVW